MHAVHKLQRVMTVTASKAGRPATLEMDSLAGARERSKSGRPAIGRWARTSRFGERIAVMTAVTASK